MTIPESFLVALFSTSVVFLVLFCVFAMVRSLSVILARVEVKKK